MIDYYTDGVSICFHDCRVIPLDPSAEVVLHWVSKDYLWGYIGANGRVRYGNSKVIPKGDPEYVAAYANQECSYYGQPLPKTIEARPRGSQRYELYDAALVSGFEAHKVPTNPRGLLATLSDGRQATIDSNQTIVFYNCKPEAVFSRMARYRQTGASWDNPVVSTVPTNNLLGISDKISSLFMSGQVQAVQLRFVGNSSQLIYPRGYIVSVELV